MKVAYLAIVAHLVMKLPKNERMSAYTRSNLGREGYI